MKQQRKIKVKSRRAESLTHRTDMLVVGAFSNRKSIAAALRPLDIAGMDVFNSGTETATPGSSGFGVRLLCAFLTHMSAR